MGCPSVADAFLPAGTSQIESVTIEFEEGHELEVRADEVRFSCGLWIDDAPAIEASRKISHVARRPFPARAQSVELIAGSSVAPAPSVGLVRLWTAEAADEDWQAADFTRVRELRYDSEPVGRAVTALSDDSADASIEVTLGDGLLQIALSESYFS